MYVNINNDGAKENKCNKIKLCVLVCVLDPHTGNYIEESTYIHVLSNM